MATGGKRVVKLRQKETGQAAAGKLGFRGEVVEEPGAHDHKLPKGTRKVKNGNRKPMEFVSLHHHSTFSYGDGYQLPEVHVRRATELQMDALAMTEHGNMSSHAKLEKACEGTGVKPLFGVELYTGAIDEENRSRKKNHLTVLAQSQEGYQSLIRLVSRSFAEGFYSEPTVSEEMLAEEGDGLVVLSGCQGSLLFTSLVGGKLVPEEDASYKRALRVARRFREQHGDNYFIEVQAFPELEKTCLANPQLERISRATGAPLVASLDCHYTAPEEAEIQKILHNTRPGENRTLEEMEREWGYAAPLCPPINDATMLRKLIGTGLSRGAAIEAIKNTRLIADACKVELPKLPMVQYPLPPGYSTARELWREWIKDGWKFRGFNRLPQSQRQEYQERLRYEMKIIEDKGFENYFLMVADATRWAKDNGVAVGPARGSAAASLVAYCLRITEVNPLIHRQLVFERFIDVTREDYPDIDLDFDSETRWRLRESLTEKYGEGMVFNLGTFTYYKSKNSLDDVARVFRIPKWEVETVKGQLIERSSGDLRASATIEDTVEQFEESAEVVKRHPELLRAADLEGNVKGFGVHAAGLLIGDVRKVAPVVQRTIKDHDVEVVAVDKKDAAYLGLLKMDYLGLNTMTLLAYACEWTGMSLTDLYNLPLDDPEVIEGFRRNDVAGIFQFEGQTCRLVNGAIKPDSFQEVCDVTALARPGPLHNGSAEAYIHIKWSEDRTRSMVVEEDWPSVVHDILDFTKGQIVYQEQILRIVREVGNFSWTAAAEIRRIISRKEGEQAFNRKRDEFLAGCAELHPDFPRDQAARLWAQLITAGAYTFNLAHTVSYGMISIWCMWFKVHHPAVFYAAALRALGDHKTVHLLRDASRHDIEVKPPSIKRSGVDWEPVRGKVQMGFAQIKGIGEKTAESIVDHDQRPLWKRWDDLIVVKGIGPKTVELMRDFARQADPLGVFEIDERLQRARDALPSLGLTEPTHTADEIPYESGIELKNVTWIGIAKDRNLRDLYESNRAHGRELDPKEIKDPHLREFCLILGDDGEELLRLRFDRWKYPSMKKAIWGLELGKDVLWIQGRKPAWRAARELYVSDMVVIDVEED